MHKCHCAHCTLQLINRHSHSVKCTHDRTQSQNGQGKHFLDRQVQTSDKEGTSTKTFNLNPKLLENRGLSAPNFVLLETIFEQKCLLTEKNSLWEGK